MKLTADSLEWAESGYHGPAGSILTGIYYCCTCLQGLYPTPWCRCPKRPSTQKSVSRYVHKSRLLSECTGMSTHYTVYCSHTVTMVNGTMELSLELSYSPAPSRLAVTTDKPSSRRHADRYKHVRCRRMSWEVSSRALLPFSALFCRLH